MYQKLGNSLPFILVVLMASLHASSCPAQTPNRVLRPTDLIENPSNYLGRSIEIEIVEPLYGPSTPAALAALEYGQVRIQIPDAVGAEFALVPAAFQPNDPNRYRKKFDQVLTTPLRVRGEFLSDEDLAKQTRRPAYVIRVSSVEPIVPGPAEPVPSLAALKSDPARYDRKRIVYEGVYRSGFEVSALDKEIWLATERNTTIVGRPGVGTGGSKMNRVRVTGTLFAKPGAHYGHLGGYNFEILASKVEYLGSALVPK